MVGGDSEQKKIKKRNRKGEIKWYAGVAVVVAAVVSFLVSLSFQMALRKPVKFILPWSCMR